MTGLEHSILGLKQALNAPRRHHMWRWLVRHRMAGVKDALTAQGACDPDGWLAPRELSLQRECQALLGRLTALGPQVLTAPDIEPVRHELLRLVSDLEHHRQRINDLVYDSVSLELGGSE